MASLLSALTGAWARLRATLGSPRRLLGTLAFALLSLGLNLYFTFPADALAERLAYEIQQRSNGVWRLSFGHAATWRLSGLSLADVDLHRLATGDSAPPPIHLDRLQARLQVVPLLLRRPRLVVKAAQGSGTFSAWLAPGAQTLDVEASLTDLSMAQPALQDVLGVATAGKLSAEIDAHYEPDPTKWIGELKLDMSQFSAGPGAVVGMSLPQIAFGDIAMQLKANEGALRLHALRQHGGVVTLQGRGGASLKTPLVMSTLDVCATVRVAPEFLATQPKLSTALQIAAAQLKRDPDGTLHIPLQGSFLQPRLGNVPCH